ncbi:hypothetical protein TNIN_48371 [Trichonephila inaurata madagascariensis]|uniref:Uncharacterized protein n=1 Tax=Trichonephila inaurata madagascariensis TaxID=2747483 RepID=A0A8X6YKZ8_9ARAC|nr:hypothetical protein TNIN_48371 [Trichonephila inaurata madagascariensis]
MLCGHDMRLVKVRTGSRHCFCQVMNSSSDTTKEPSSRPGWPLLEPGTRGVKRRAPGGPQSLLTSQGQRGRLLWDAISSRPSTLPG